LPYCPIALLPYCPAEMHTKPKIENRLFEQELAMLAERYLRDLRRDATVAIRQ
jgi:hypothetical protein